MTESFSNKSAELRKRAEAKLAGIISKSLPNVRAEDARRLAHELRVHEIELELQCEELQRAQAQADESRNRYRELYESIPIGYVTLDVQGRIVDLNPAGAALLGKTAGQTRGIFNTSVAVEDLDRFTLFCREVLASRCLQTGEFKMQRGDGSHFFALLQGIPARTGEAQDTMLRILFKDITVRKQAEAVLLRHEAELIEARDRAESAVSGALNRESQTARQLLVSSLRLDSILQAAMDAIITVDDQQRIVLFNEAAEAMFGRAAAEAVGQSLDQFIPPQFRESHRHDVDAFGASGVTSRRMGTLGTVTGLRVDGSEFPVEAAISHITVEGKKYYTVILRDVTERYRAEEAIRQSELRLRSTLDMMLEGCQIVGFDWTYVYVNEAAARHARRSRQELIGRTMLDVFPGIEAQHLFTVLRHAMETRSSAKLENEFVYPDGTKAVFHLCFEPVPEGLLILSFDITDRKQAEHLIKQSEERYRRLIAVSPYAILVTRADRVIFANDQAIKLFDAVKADEILGKSPYQLFHPEWHAAIRERIELLLSESQTVPVVDEEIVTLDGTRIDVEVSAARFTDEEGPAILMMLRDISERKRLQEQLRKTERIAELGTLASGMAHEIGTPMNVILGRAEYLMDRVQDETIKRGLQTIVTQVERITKVMNQLLAFARRKPLDRVPLALNHIVEGSVDMFQERLARARVRVELDQEDGCPKVLADADQMSQVFINLIMNALHAMPEGGSLRIGLSSEGASVKVTVADTGQGIPPDALKRIFEPFFTTKEFGKGTGLGLTVVKGIVEEHQGRIAVESRPHRGTTFTILLPAVAAQP